MTRRWHTSVNGGPGQKLGRLEALSDGVFAVALTLLILDVMTAGKEASHEGELAAELLSRWPTFTAYLVGFLTILVCWVNHHRVFHYVKKADTGLFWINGLQLALVAAVPLPTALLADNLQGPGFGTASLIYGICFFLMATSFWALFGYVHARGLSDPSVDPDRYSGMGRIYFMAVIWTALCLGALSFSLVLALIMWTVMFVVFAFPAEFAHLIHLSSSVASPTDTAE